MWLQTEVTCRFRTIISEKFSSGLAESIDAGAFMIGFPSQSANYIALRFAVDLPQGASLRLENKHSVD